MLAILLKFAAIWLVIDTIIVTVMWYLAKIIKPRYPDWWRRMITD